jgi:hypothetical protein
MKCKKEKKETDGRENFFSRLRLDSGNYLTAGARTLILV